MTIKFDKRNYRKHNDKNKELIKKSLQECGAGRSIVIDSENEIVAGNGIYEEAQALNIPVKIVETDGSELVVVKRTDLKTDDEKRKQLAIMDNSTSDSSEFDYDLLSVDFDNKYLEDLGIEIEDISIDTEEAQSDKEIDISQRKVKVLISFDQYPDFIVSLLEKIKQENPDLFFDIQIKD